MMPDAPWPSNRILRASVALAVLGVAGSTAHAISQDRQTRKPANSYWVYVGAESADLIHRVRFGPDGTSVEKTISIGELPNEMEGPHGLAISADGKFLYMTTGHGRPDGKWWKYELPSDKLVGEGVELGFFPASIDVTPDGLYALSVNFNLHGDMVPSTVSVVYTPTNTEVARIVTCTMPHGSRIDPSGTRQYSTCMMDDQLVEIDARKFEVSRRFSVAKGKEGALPIGEGARRRACGPRARGAAGASGRSGRGRLHRRSSRDDAGDVLADVGTAFSRWPAHLRRVQQG